MASEEKRAKRARRAKDKAKQARTTRAKAAQYGVPDSVELSPRTLDLFERMMAAECVSRIEMLSVLLMESELMDGSDPVAAQRIMLGLYHEWKHGGQTAVRMGWWAEESFLEDYALAAHKSGRSNLIESWKFGGEPT